MDDPVAEQRYRRHGALDLAFKPRVLFADAQPRKVLAYRAYVFAYGHFVVVEHRYYGKLLAAYRVKRLVREPARKRAVADNGYHAVALAVLPYAFGKPRRHRQRSGRMPRDKGVVLALLGLRETRYAAVFAQPVEIAVAPRQQLMRVSLVSDVENDFIVGAIEHVMQRHGKLHRAEVGRQMPAVVFHNADNTLAQILANAVQLGDIKPL